MELSIVKYIKEHGLEKTVEDFKLILKEKDHKILLKYNQINSPFKHIEVQESRGLILEKDTWKVLSLGFTKFFNHGESLCPKINWKNAHVLEKLDGSFIQFYFDYVTNEWCVGTTGLTEGEGLLKNNISFKDLFFQICDINFDKLMKRHTYMFELTSPFNKVVKIHDEPKITFIGLRNLETLQEYTYEQLMKISEEINVTLVKRYNISDINTIKDTFKNMKFYDEGFVVVDDKFNRCKIKNPGYVAAHHLKGSTEPHNILEIIKNNEVDEYLASFPEFKEKTLLIKDKYYKLIEDLNNIWDKLYKPKSIQASERKKFAQSVFENIKEYKQFNSIFFLKRDIEDYIRNYDNKKLYKFLNK